MSNGYPHRQIVPVSIASNGLTGTADLGNNAWKKVFLDAQGLGAEWAIQASQDGVTYAPVHERVNTAPVQYQAVTVPSSASGTWVPLDINARYVQFVATATAANGVTGYLVCTR